MKMDIENIPYKISSFYFQNELSIAVVNVSIDDKMSLSNIFAECVKPNNVVRMKVTTILYFITD